MGFLNFLYSTYGTYGNYGNYGNYGGFNNPSTTNTDWAAVAGLVGGIFAGLGVLLIFILAAAVLMIVAKWIIFKKMGIDGWKSIISTVNTYLQMEATGVEQRWFLVFIIGVVGLCIPFVNFLVIIGLIVAGIYFYVLYMVSLARSFDKTDGFAVGLILRPVAFLCILAFGDSKYVGARPMNDIIFK